MKFYKEVEELVHLMRACIDFKGIKYDPCKQCPYRNSYRECSSAMLNDAANELERLSRLTSL